MALLAAVFCTAGFREIQGRALIPSELVRKKEI